jgi:hypothetical protein
VSQFPEFDAQFLYQGIFGALPRPFGRGVAASRQAPPSEPASPEPGSEPVEHAAGASEAREEKPKVLLRNLAWSVPQGSFNGKARFQLEADLPAALAHLTRLEIKIVALTPDGKEPIDRKEIHLKQGQAAGEATLFYPRYREDGNLPASCDFIFTAKHRDSEEAESPRLTAKQPFVSNLRWEKAEEWFGVPVKLLANTCLKDGEEVTVKVASENGLALDTKAKAKKGGLEIVWTPCLCGVGPDGDGKYPEKVEYYAEVSKGEERAVPEKNFFLKVVGKTGYHTFPKDYTWDIYGVHAEFRQRLENGALDVQVRKPIVKAWQGYQVNMIRAGLVGTVKGCPYESYRWGRAAGAGPVPNQYHDGDKWVPMPPGHTPSPKEYSAYGFIQSGTRYVRCGESSAIWPDPFPDYDFDEPRFVKKRKDWKSDTDTRWSRKFLIRPRHCKQGTRPGGCGYPLGLNLELEKVTAWKEDAIAVCKGIFRSNAGCFSLEDPRHYANFSEVVETQIEKKLGRNIGFQAAEE